MTKIYVGEIGVELRFVIREDNKPVDLTGTTVTLIIAGGTTKTCTLVNTTNGVCKYVVESGVFAAAGTKECQLKIVSGSDTFYTDKFDIDVQTIVS